MKNTLTLNIKNGYELEHISNINDGTDRLILMLKCDASSGVNVQNSLGTFSVNVDSDLFSVEIPTPLWIGLGSEVLTITAGADSYGLTINKTPAAGGNYQLEKVTDTEIRFSKVRDNFPEVFYPDREQIVGTWHNGKPIYRKFIEADRYLAGSSGTTHTLDVQGLDIDEIINVQGMMRRMASGNEGQFYFANAYSSYFEVKSLVVGLTQENQKGISVQQYWTGYYTVWIDYTKTTDAAVGVSRVSRNMGEYLGQFTLAWEGDLNVDAVINLSESILDHKMIAFEVSGQAPTSNQYNMIYRVPTDMFRDLYDNGLSPTSKYICAYYDTYNDLFTYISETMIYFDFVTTQRLRRIWFVD